MNTTQKKYLSAFAVVIGGATLTLINAYAVRLPAEIQGFIGSVLGGALLLLKAWGSAEEEQVKVEAKAQVIAADAIGKEPEAPSRES
jgi:hypothetical protein